jgi:predicted MPP superfamily phosphohydrolase
MMRSIIVVTLLILIDWYAFQAVRTVMKKYSSLTRKTITVSYWIISMLSIAGIILMVTVDYLSLNNTLRTCILGLAFSTYFPKLIICPFLAVDDIVRLFRWIAAVINNRIIKTKSISPAQPVKKISRLTFISKLGLAVAAVPFGALIYGMLGSAYRHQLRRVKLQFPSLPQGFNGLRIVQISDIHIGSFVSGAPLRKAIEMVRDLSPDIIFFTGDLVNNVADETNGFLDTLKQVQAPMGVYSILGNHDYGEYLEWKSEEDKKTNLHKLKSIQSDLGWKLLLNENVSLSRKGDEISLIGVEYWGTRAGSHNYGDLKKATENIKETPFTILLSHDPSHWSEQVIKDFPKIDMMLAGHTHGMQFGIEVPGFKWSPIQYIYKHWAGLYQNGSQYLYVNRGLGFLGYPGRVGILPEITLIELEKGS